MDVFDPVKYTLEENEFFLNHLGESPMVAMEDALPQGVNPAAVQEVLGAVYDLKELETHRGRSWVGTEAVADSIKVYLREWHKWKELSKRGAPRFPTMYAWDSKGKPHRGGVGSDSGQRVSTYIDEQGIHHPLQLELHDSAVPDMEMPWAQHTKEPIPDEIIHDAKNGKLECPGDGWATNYNPDSRMAYNVARARMARHCKTSKDDRVREFGLKVFG